MYQQDLLLRLIHQLGDAVARAVGLARNERYEEALEEVREAKGRLRIVPGLLEHLAPAALLELLGPEQARALAQLFETEASILEQMGRRPFADRARRRGRDLLALLDAGNPRDTGKSS
jgi:hypothetical protein